MEALNVSKLMLPQTYLQYSHPLCPAERDRQEEDSEKQARFKTEERRKKGQSAAS